MKKRVGDEKLIIISVAVRGINDHIRFYSDFVQLPSTPLTQQEHRPVPPNANSAVWILIRVVVFILHYLWKVIGTCLILLC